MALVEEPEEVRKLSTAIARDLVVYHEDALATWLVEPTLVDAKMREILGDAFLLLSRRTSLSEAGARAQLAASLVPLLETIARARQMDMPALPAAAVTALFEPAVAPVRSTRVPFWAVGLAAACLAVAGFVVAHSSRSAVARTPPPVAPPVQHVDPVPVSPATPPEDPDPTGSFEVESSELGNFSLATTSCISGRSSYFYGFDLIGNARTTRLRVVFDPLRGPQVGVGEPPETGTMVPLSSDCEVHVTHLSRAGNVIANVATGLQGQIDVSCSKRAKTRVNGHATFECR